MSALEDLASGGGGSALQRLAGHSDSNPFAPVAHAAQSAASGLGRVLDAQRYGLNRAITGESDPDKQMTNLRRGLHVEDAYQAAGHIPVVGHAIQGVTDAVLGGATDPLTYETLGAGPALKALGLGTKLAGAARAVTDTPLGRAVADKTMWGSEVGRTLGPEARDTARGAANVGTSARARTQSAFQRMSAKALEPLSDSEIVNVGRALNGDILQAELAPGKERTAYAQLRRLTEFDYKMRTNAFTKGLFDQNAKDLSDAEKASLWKSIQTGVAPEVPKPIVPRVKAPYGPDVPRSRTPTLHGAETVPYEQIYTDAMAGLADTDVKALRKALYDNNPSGLSDSLRGRFQTVSDAGKAKLYGIKGEPQVLSPAQRYKLPHPNQAEIDRAKVLQDRYSDIKLQLEKHELNYRRDYLPGTHVDPLAAEDRGAREYDMLKPEDPRAQQREQIPVTSADQVKTGFDSMAKNVGVQVGAARVRDALGKLADAPEIQDLFKVRIGAKGTGRTDPQKVGDFIKTIVGYPRAAIVSLTPRHAVNILDLLANTDPGALPGAVDLARKLIGAKTPAEYAKLTQPGRDLGALAGDYLERKPFFSDFAEDVPKWMGQAGQTYAHGVENSLGRWTKLMTKITWAVDDAAKTVYAQRIAAKKGISDLTAGGRAARELVDYANVAPIVENLRYVAPFATFRASVPGAVLGGVARNPARAAALNRLTGGGFYGGKTDNNAQWYAPTADVGRAIAKPQDYVRSTIGQPYQAAGTLGLEAMTAGQPGASVRDIATELQDAPGALRQGKLPMPRRGGNYGDIVALRRSRFLTYGNPVDLRWLLDAAAAGIPEAQNALTQIGATPFQPRQGDALQRLGGEALYQTTGVNIR